MSQPIAVVDKAMDVIGRAVKSGWVEFRLDDITVAVCRRDTEALHEMKQTLAMIRGVAADKGLEFFSFRDERTRETVFRVETKEYQAQRRAELDARVTRMKALRPTIGTESTP